MASIIKIADIAGIKETLLNFYKVLRNFLATKTEMDVVATSLTDLDRRIDESIQSIEVGTVTTGSPGSSAQVTNVGTDTDVVLNFTIPKGDKGDKGEPGEQGPQGEQGDTGATPRISIGTVNTVDSNKDAAVTNSGTYPDVVLNFSIPRGEQGDLKELNDTSERIEVVKKWQSSSSVVFASIVEVPIPTEQAMYSLADCIKQTNLLTNLKIKLSSLSATYQCNALHWHIQCSNIYSSRVVYSTKYATPDADFVSVETAVNSAPPTTIEITVTSEKGGARYVHVVIENVYGRAYYYTTKK